MFGLDPLHLGTTARTGLPQWLAEFVAAFGLVLTIFDCVRFKPDAAAFAGIAPSDVPGFIVAQLLGGTCGGRSRRLAIRADARA
jgi:glycerol uptake facilitator-like aquaporin